MKMPCRFKISKEKRSAFHSTHMINCSEWWYCGKDNSIQSNTPSLWRYWKSRNKNSKISNKKKKKKISACIVLSSFLLPCKETHGRLSFLIVANIRVSATPEMMCRCKLNPTGELKIARKCRPMPGERWRSFVWDLPINTGQIPK